MTNITGGLTNGGRSDYVILPTYHVLGAYFSRRMREAG